MGYRPSKSIKHAVDNIHALTERTSTWQDATMLVAKINRHCVDGPTTSQLIPPARHIGRSTATK